MYFQHMCLNEGKPEIDHVLFITCAGSGSTLSVMFWKVGYI